MPVTRKPLRLSFSLFLSVCLSNSFLSDMQAGSQAGRLADRQTSRQTGRQRDGQAGRHAGRQTDGQAGRQADRQEDRERNRQTERPKNGQTHKQREYCFTNTQSHWSESTRQTGLLWSFCFLVPSELFQILDNCRTSLVLKTFSFFSSLKNKTKQKTKKISRRLYNSFSVQ